MAYEQKFGPHPVPILVEKCAEFILEHGVSEEGIFRLPGQDNLVKQLRDAFDAGERPSFDRYAVLTLHCPVRLCPAQLTGERTSWSQEPLQRLQKLRITIGRRVCSVHHSEFWDLGTVRRVCKRFIGHSMFCADSGDD